MIIYLLNVLDNISAVAIMISIVCAFCVAITTIGSIVESYDDDKERCITARKKFILALIISTTISIFVPNKKTLATIYVLQNEDVQETIKNIPELTKLTTEYLIDNFKKE